MAQFVPTLVDLLAYDESESFRLTVADHIRLTPTQSELVRALGQSAREDSSLKVRFTAVETLARLAVLLLSSDLRT